MLTEEQEKVIAHVASSGTISQALKEINFAKSTFYHLLNFNHEFHEAYHIARQDFLDQVEEETSNMTKFAYRKTLTKLLNKLDNDQLTNSDELKLLQICSSDYFTKAMSVQAETKKLAEEVKKKLTMKKAKMIEARIEKN